MFCFNNEGKPLILLYFLIPFHMMGVAGVLGGLIKGILIFYFT